MVSDKANLTPEELVIRYGVCPICGAPRMAQSGTDTDESGHVAHWRRLTCSKEADKHYVQ